MKDSLKEDEKMSEAYLTYVGVGVGCVIGPIPMGFIQDRFGHKATIYYIMALVLIFSTLLIAQNEV